MCRRNSRNSSSSRRGLLVTALAPLLPQIIGSVFNISYNRFIVNPLLATEGLKHRFIETVIAYNLLVYPLAVAAWIDQEPSSKPTLTAEAD